MKHLSSSTKYLHLLVFCCVFLGCHSDHVGNVWSKTYFLTSYTISSFFTTLNAMIIRIQWYHDIQQKDKKRTMPRKCVGRGGASLQAPIPHNLPVVYDIGNFKSISEFLDQLHTLKLQWNIFFIVTLYDPLPSFA